MENRVRIILSSLLVGLGLSLCATKVAAQIQVTSAVPNNAPQGAVNLNVIVRGNGFKKGVAAQWFVSGTTNPGGVTVNSTSFNTSNQLTANITVATDAVAGGFDIVVKNTDGRTGKGTELFAVTLPDPAIALNANGLTVMNADGSNQLNIYQPPKGACVKGSNWSPDHAMLVFEMMTNCTAGVPDGIYVINRDGSGLREVIALNGGSGMSYPVWSPQPVSDGYHKIAFSDQVAACGVNNLFVVNPDGTGLTNLTNTCSGNQYSQYYPSWDPAGTRLAVQVYPCAVNIGCSAHLYVYDLGLVNGLFGVTGTTDLTASGGTMGGLWVYRSDWSRTQDKIVFKARFLSNINNSALWIVSLIDPANPVELTATYNNGSDPSWSPDDSRIVFTRTVQQKATVSVIASDGSTITDLASMGGSPAWRRCCPTCIIPCSP